MDHLSSDRRNPTRLNRLTYFGKIIAIALLSLNLFFFYNSSLLASEPLNPTKKLSEIEIAQQLAILPGWTVENQQLRYTYRCKNFVEAIRFVNRLVEPAETAAHHPDIWISYNQVTVSLTTHDAGGLTQKDFDLAQIISKLSF